MPFSPQYRKNQRNGDGSLEIPANGPCHSANTLGVFAGVYSVDRVRQVDQEVSQHRTIPGRSIKRPKAGPQESKKTPYPCWIRTCVPGVAAADREGEGGGSGRPSSGVSGEAPDTLPLPLRHR